MTFQLMTIVLCYVDKKRHVIDCFIDIEHVTSTTTLSLKVALLMVYFLGMD